MFVTWVLWGILSNENTFPGKNPKIVRPLSLTDIRNKSRCKWHWHPNGQAPDSMTAALPPSLTDIRNKVVASGVWRLNGQAPDSYDRSYSSRRGHKYSRAHVPLAGSQYNYATGAYVRKGRGIRVQQKSEAQGQHDVRRRGAVSLQPEVERGIELVFGLLHIAAWARQWFAYDQPF